jgi:hypothetical protein
MRLAQSFGARFGTGVGVFWIAYLRLDHAQPAFGKSSAAFINRTAGRVARSQISVEPGIFLVPLSAITATIVGTADKRRRHFAGATCSLRAAFTAIRLVVPNKSAAGAFREINPASRTAKIRIRLCVSCPRWFHANLRAKLAQFQKNSKSALFFHECFLNLLSRYQIVGKNFVVL